MSVLIKGMKMPKHCWQCAFKDCDDNCAVMYAIERKNISVFETWGESRVPDWCPLIELPDHGDLIDRDELHHNMKADAINKLSFFDDGYLHYLKGLEAVEDMLNDAPVIIPAERSEEWEFTSET